jgi:hypothetical protein
MNKFYKSTNHAYDIIKTCVLKVDTFPTSTEYELAIKKDRYGFIVFVVDGVGSLFVFNHKLFDGISSMKFMSICQDHVLFDINRIPKFRYIPGVSELKCVGGIVSTYVNTHFQRHLSYDHRWDETDTCHIGRHTQSQSYIKDIKRKFEGIVGNKTRFEVIAAGIFMARTFNHICKPKMILSITAAFQDDAHFNSISNIMVELIKPIDWNVMSDEMRQLNMIGQIDHVVHKHGADIVYGSYLMINKHDAPSLMTSGMRSQTESTFDVSISVMPQTTPAFIDGVKNTCDYIQCNRITFPIFAVVASNDDGVRFEIMSRTKDLDHKGLFSKYENIEGLDLGNFI